MAVVRRRRKKVQQPKRTHRRRARAHVVRRRRHTKRRRRSNPSVPVLLANPRRGRVRHRRRRRARSAAMVPYRARRPVHRRRRRSNPDRVTLSSRGIGYVVRIGAFGMAGVVVARISARLYTKYLAEHVQGDEGRADPKSWRNWLNELARLVAMELGTWAAERALKRLNVRPDDRLAFFVGGSAETMRQAVGVVVKKASPTTDLNNWGLGQRTLQPGEGFEDSAGRRWYMATDGKFYSLDGVINANQFHGVIEEDEFAGVQ